MKNITKVAGLFSLSLLGGVCAIASINIVNGAGLSLNLGSFSNISNKHEARVKQLYLWTDDKGEERDNQGNRIEAWMQSSTDNLDVYNGLIVEDKVNSDRNSLKLGMIGGGTNHKITSAQEHSAIVGGSGNVLGGNNALIGGGTSNSVTGTGGIVVGGNTNVGQDGGIVVGGSNNVSAGVVLGGNGNSVGADGLAMGKSAKGGDGSFVRNDGTYEGIASIESALIGSENGVLIGTYTPKAGVNLVVNGAVKVGDSSRDLTGGIVSIGECLYAYDGVKWHAFGAGGCVKPGTEMAKTCMFGRVLLQEGDVVKEAYSEPYSLECDKKKATNVVCGSDGKLKKGGIEYKYPTCYTMSNSPLYY